MQSVFRWRRLTRAAKVIVDILLEERNAQCFGSSLRQPSFSILHSAFRGYTGQVQKKVFWLIFIALSLLADFELPLLWGLLATIPIVVLSWWIAYRSDWFED